MHQLAAKIIQEDDQSFSIFSLKLTSLKSKRGLAAPESLFQNHQRKLSNFVNILHSHHRVATFTIRTIIDPQGSVDSSGQIEIVFLVKFRREDIYDSMDSQAEELYKNIKILLGGTFTEYVWKEISDSTELQRLIWPFECDEPFIAEVRRQEENVLLDTLVTPRKLGFMDSHEKPISKSGSEGVYYIHPYSPAMGGFETLIKTLMHGHQKIVLTATLSPTTLRRDEVEFLEKKIAYCEGYRPSNVSTIHIHQHRAESLSQGLVRQHLLLQDAPFYLTFSVGSEKPIESMLLEYIGLAITEPIGQGIHPSQPISSFSLHVGGYDIVNPLTDEDCRIARENLATLAQTPWNRTQVHQERVRFRYLFDGNEAVSAFYLPINTWEDLPGIETHHLDERPIPRAMLKLNSGGDEAIRLGVNHYFGFEQDVLLSEASRKQHAYIVGQTGTGKTTLMKTMILSDMKAGNGICVIDPHGELYHELVGLIPDERIEDVVLFDPSDSDYPVGFNLLEFSNNEERESIIKEMRAILKRYVMEYYQYSSGEYAGAVFFQHMQNNMMLASSDLENPGTILQVNNIFMQEDYWKRWLPLKWDNFVLRNWVENYLPNIDYFARTRDGYVPGDYYSSKLADFTNDPRIALIFGQPFSTINFKEVIGGKKILLINLSKGQIGEANASMLGMMLMAKLDVAFMSRLKNQGGSVKPETFYLYVDEFQSIATENFSILLAESRKFGLGLILANQYLQQIQKSRILDAVFGNVGTIISFRLGLEDARIMESQFMPEFNVQDLCNLPNYYAVMRANVAGQRTNPCTIKTILPPEGDAYADRNAVLALSRKKYATSKREAELMVEASLTRQIVGKIELYWEKEGTPEHQLIRNNGINELGGYLDDDGEELETDLDQLAQELREKIYLHLRYKKMVDGETLNEIFGQDTRLPIHPGGGFCKFVEKEVAPRIGESSQDVIGIYNQLVKGLIESRIDFLRQFPLTDQKKKEVDYIQDLMAKDKWRSVGRNIKAMMQAPVEIPPKDEDEDSD